MARIGEKGCTLIFGGIVKGLGGIPLAVGGTSDHVHLLVGLKSSHRLDYFVRDLKADSSEWIHREIGRRLFAWQKGYGAFAVSPSDVKRVRSYVIHQKQHHSRLTFPEEYLRLLQGVASHTTSDIFGESFAHL